MVEFLPLIRQKDVSQPRETLDKAKEDADKINSDLTLYGRLQAVGEVAAEQVPITDELTFVMIPRYLQKYKGAK